HDPVQARGADARTGRRSPGGGRGGGHERVGAVVHVQHRGLAGFEHQGLALVQRVVQGQGGVGDHRPDAVGIGEELIGDLVDVGGPPVVDLQQDLVLQVEGAFDLVAQQVGVEQVGDADAHAAHLVGVGGPDTAAGGADLALAQEPFGDLVQGAVVRGDHVRAGGD